MNYSEVRDLHKHVGGDVTVRGWVQTLRSHGKIGFIVLRDGTGVVQCVLVKKELDDATWERFGTLTQESSVGITGSVREDSRAPGGYELTVRSFEVFQIAQE